MKSELKNMLIKKGVELTNEDLKDIESIEIDSQKIKIFSIFEMAYDYHYKKEKFGDLELADTIDKISKGNKEKFATVMMDVHESLNLEMEYLVLEENETFENLADVINYFIYYSLKIN
jgi:hypothetical protein